MKPNLDSDEIYTPQADAPAEACEDISVPEENGENPSKTRPMRPKPREMATQNKIVSKNASSSLTLPEMPKMDTSGSMGGMKAGGPSSGFGDGGNGGGIGPGQGVGIGGGRNFGYRKEG